MSMIEAKSGPAGAPSPRLNYRDANPQALRGMFALEEAARHCGLEESLLELIRMRVSQINGCAYCLDMHSKDARAQGESEQRLYTLSAWRETPFFTERERAALAWTEAVTLLSQNDVPDDLYASVSAQFSESEMVSLTIAAIAINGWNRLAIPFRALPGSYVRAVGSRPERA